MVKTVVTQFMCRMEEIFKVTDETFIFAMQQETMCEISSVQVLQPIIQLLFLAVRKRFALTSLLQIHTQTV